MAQELKYIIRTELDKGSVKSVTDQLNAIQSGARGNGAGEVKEQTKEKKQLSLILDELTKKYLENAEALVSLRDQVNLYKAQLSDLKAITQSGAELTKQQKEQEEALRVSIRDTNKDISDKQREMITLQQQNEATGSSIHELEKRMRALMAEMKRMPQDTEEQRAELEKLRNEYMKVRNQVNSFNETLGNHQHNVGNYENSIRSAANALAIFQGPLGPVAGRINAFATALKRAETGALAGSKSMKVLAFALKAVWLSLGPLAIAFASLLAFFKRTERGQEQLRVIIAGFRATVDTLIERIIPLGEWLVKVFTEPKEAMQDVADFLKNQIIVRFNSAVKIATTAFSIISNGAKASALAIKGIFDKEAREESKQLFKQVGEDTIKIGKLYVDVLSGVENAVDKLVDGTKKFNDELEENRENAKKLEREMNAVLRIERELKVARSEQNRDLQRARDTARDISASFEERLEALAQVRESELGLIEQELENERERLRIMQEQDDMFSSNAEQLNAVADQQAKVNDIEREHLVRSMSLRRDENSIIRAKNELLLRESRRAFDMIQRASEMNIAEVQREMTKRGEIVELAQKRMTQFTENRIEEERLLVEQYQQELINQYGDEEKARVHFAEAAARAEHEIRLKELALQNDLDDAQENRDRARLNAQLQNESMARQSALNEQLHQLELQNDKIGMLEAERRALEVEMEREHEHRLQELREQMEKQGIDSVNATLLAEEQLRLEFAERFADIDRRTNDQVIANRKEMIDALVNLTKAGLSAIFGESKTVSIALAIIDTLAAMTAALGRRPWTPVNYLHAAAVGAQGFANVRRIRQTTQSGGGSTSAPSRTSAPRPSEQFQLIDTQGMASGIATQVASSVSRNEQAMQPVIVLEGEFDNEFLAVKVREGNNAISSRGVVVRTP